MKTAGFLAIGPLGLMAGGPEDHFTDSRELYVLVEGDEWAHSIAWLPIPQAEPQLGQQLPSPHGAPQSAHPPGRKRLPRKGFRTSSPELQAASFAYDWPDEMPADGELTATPGRRPELLIWADNAHTRWQLTASLPRLSGVGIFLGGCARFCRVACSVERRSAGDRMDFATA